MTYQDSCHWPTPKASSTPPRLLNAIPGLKLVEMEGSDMCCGAAGVYNVTHRTMSDQLLDNKMRHAAATGADVIATANPGCMLQLEAGARARHAHPRSPRRRAPRRLLRRRPAAPTPEEGWALTLPREIFSMTRVAVLVALV